MYSFNLSEECDALRVKCAGSVADVHQFRCSFEEQNEGRSAFSVIFLFYCREFYAFVINSSLIMLHRNYSVSIKVTLFCFFPTVFLVLLNQELCVHIFHMLIQ